MTGSRTTQVTKDRRVAEPPHCLRRSLKTRRITSGKESNGADALHPLPWPGELPDGSGSNRVRPLALSLAHDTRLRQHIVLKHATCHR